MILVINVCKEKLHYFEFVKPVEDILKREDVDFFTRHYNDIKKNDLENCGKVIICGTSLKDNGFLENIEKFSWIKEFEKPIFGICAGMQIIGLVFKGRIRNQLEIGYFYEEFKKGTAGVPSKEGNFFGLNGKVEVYHLHNNYIEFSKDFEIYSRGKIPQAVRCKIKEIYGVLFHPEVRQKEIIREFVRS
ncbi:MAG: gamma-glutamyl-gamma-aminobutyrate hydrolase family protein [Nanoarchaeota archaeon]|nr:gamma-glutamyl-gamma-aminobutyrate hydrolase family protein [Nanoarchaeota archaeon]